MFGYYSKIKETNIVRIEMKKIVFGSDIQDDVTIYVSYLIDGGQEKIKYKK